MAAAGAAARLPEVVVSGARSERTLDEVPAAVDILRDDALDPAEVQDIRDLVREIPNVSVKRAAVRFSAVSPGGTGRDGNAGFNIRGLEGNRVLLLVDGVRVPRELVSGVFGSAAFGRDYYDLGLVSRVEILRGAHSALYGSDGLAGVVAMYTTQPSDLLRGGSSWGGRAVAAFDGEDRARRIGLTLASAAENWQWLGSVQLGRARELSNQGERVTADSSRTAPNPERFEHEGLLAKLVHTPGGGQRHTFTVEYVNREGEVEVLSGRSAAIVAPTSVADLDGTLSMRRARLSWDGRWRLDAPLADELRVLLARQNARAFESATEWRPLQPPAQRERQRQVTYEEALTQLAVQAQRTQAVGGGWSARWVYGLDVIRTDMDNLLTGTVPPPYERYPLKRFPDTRESTTALFAQAEWAQDAWSLIPALRYDRVRLRAARDALYPLEPAQLSDGAWSPKIGVIWRAHPRQQVFANVAAGFRAPGPLQLNNFFENLSGASGAYKTIPNPNLKPETSRTLELGWRGQEERWQWEAVLFRGRYRDFIEDLVYVGGRGTVADPLIFQSVNRSRVTLHGLEFKGRLDLTPSTAVRWAWGRTEGTVDTTGKPLNSVNPPELIVGVEHRVDEALALGASLRHVRGKKAGDVDDAGIVGGQFRPPAFTTLDVRMRWRLDRDWQLSAAVRNLTDRRYWEWTNVRGLSATSPVLEAYTAAGRSLAVALTRSF
ncbi:TonB-dependent hemoglobin/transferrin/lactoferrin family receptor [Tepidimonas alkaliphilus]|uniref:TonB-dependent hemoglobin/transferrin/lactoferrin family receptor n=1 Tax=Tepidimonas alkaliphilus TaxID=2588942 RepID=UPI00163DB2A9|nr:TonB-dependent hemoglobin/transferrin/lactoferrin family receptor [Tepidimonas alkaliphilus]